MNLLDFSVILDALDDSVAVIDSDGAIVWANRHWHDFSRRNDGPADAYVGRNYFDMVPDDDAAQAVRRVLHGAGVERREYSCHSPVERRWFEAVVRAIDFSGRRHALFIHRNITQSTVLRDQAVRLRKDAAFLAAVVASSHDAMLSYDLEGRITSWNPAAERLYGFTADETIGRSLEIIFPPDWPKPLSAYRDEIIRGALRSFEVVRRTKSGEERKVWVSAAPVFDIDGRVIAVSNIHRDITEWRLQEESRAIIAREMLHRAKNMLAVISAIHRRMAATAKDLDTFNIDFGNRLQSLAKSADFLTDSSWATTPLRALVRSQTSLFRLGEDDRIQLRGPDVELRPQAVKAIGMALHELGTNSMKYGALGRDNGGATIAWDLVEGGGLAFSWREPDATIDGPPDVTGFGHTMLTTLARSLLDTEVDYRLDRDGVTWGLVIPRRYFVLPGSEATSEIPEGPRPESMRA